MTIFALDTNIISYLLKKDAKVFNNYQREVNYGNECVIPPVSYYEIKRGLLICNAFVKAASFERMCNEFYVGEMDIATWNEAARLYAANRQQGKMIEDADLFIAAFCLVNNYTLVTNNIKHFLTIDGLKLVNWKE